MFRKIWEIRMVLVAIAFASFGFECLDRVFYKIYRVLELPVSLSAFDIYSSLLSIFLTLALIKWSNVEIMPRVRRKDIWTIIFLPFGFVVLSFIVQFISDAIGRHLLPNTKASLLGSVQGAFLSKQTIGSYFFAILLAPIREELCYRSLLIGNLVKRYSFGLAIAVSSLTFTFFHLPLSALGPGGGIAIERFFIFDVPFLILSGCVLGVIFFRYGFIGSLITHTIGNAFIVNKEFVADNPWLALLNILGVVILVRELYRELRSRFKGPSLDEQQFKSNRPAASG